MKNLYFLAAVAAFVLGSCTVEEALDPPAGPEDEASAIGFGTFLDRVPQNGIKPLADIVDIDKLKGQGFMVKAYEHAKDEWNEWNDAAKTAMPNFMSAQTVTWSGSTSTSNGTWTYSPIKYWPRNISVWYPVSFFAYTPSPTPSTTVTFVAAGAEDENKNPKLHYSMSPNSRLQTDLIVDAKYNARGSDNKVTFNFDHVLSRIGFKAKIPESYGATTITITRLTFFYNRLHISGTYTFNSTTGQNNKTPGNWKVPDESTVTTGTTLFSASVTLTTESEPYNLAEYHTPHRYLMLIPQENAAGQAYVTLEYTIHYPPTTPPAQSDGATVYLPHTIWEPGKAYTYTLSVAPKAVIVDVDEGVDWNDWDEVEVTPPINVQ